MFTKTTERCNFENGLEKKERAQRACWYVRRFHEEACWRRVGKEHLNRKEMIQEKRITTAVTMWIKDVDWRMRRENV